MVDIKTTGHALNHVSAKLNGMSKGMGIDLERFNTSWLKCTRANVLKFKIEHGVKFKDPTRFVSSGSEEVEVDVLCRESLILLESATFLGPTKLESFITSSRSDLLKNC